MGYPMVENMVKKLSPSVKIYVFDVSEEAVKKICSENKDRVFGCSNSKEVAQKSVRASRSRVASSIIDRLIPGNHLDDGS